MPQEARYEAPAPGCVVRASLPTLVRPPTLDQLELAFQLVVILRYLAPVSPFLVAHV